MVRVGARSDAFARLSRPGRAAERDEDARSDAADDSATYSPLGGSIIGSSPQTAHGLDLEVQKIIDPHGRGRQYVAAQLEKLAGTRVAGFVLSRQAPVGKWGAATYALSKIMTEEANGSELQGGQNPMPPMMPMVFRLVPMKKRRPEPKSGARTSRR